MFLMLMISGMSSQLQKGKHLYGMILQYIREPSFFDACEKPVKNLTDIENAAVLGYFGDFITTDHISPAGVIPEENPTTPYLLERGVEKKILIVLALVEVIMK